MSYHSMEPRCGQTTLTVRLGTNFQFDSMSNATQHAMGKLAGYYPFKVPVQGMGPCIPWLVDRYLMEHEVKGRLDYRNNTFYWTFSPNAPYAMFGRIVWFKDQHEAAIFRVFWG